MAYRGVFRCTGIGLPGLGRDPGCCLGTRIDDDDLVGLRPPHPERPLHGAALVVGGNDADARMAVEVGVDHVGRQQGNLVGGPQVTLDELHETAVFRG